MVISKQRKLACALDERFQTRRFIELWVRKLRCIHFYLFGDFSLSRNRSKGKTQVPKAVIGLWQELRKN